MASPSGMHQFRWLPASPQTRIDRSTNIISGLQWKANRYCRILPMKEFRSLEEIDRAGLPHFSVISETSVVSK